MIIVMKDGILPESPEVPQVIKMAERYPNVRAEVRKIQGATRVLTEIYLLGQFLTLHPQCIHTRVHFQFGYELGKRTLCPGILRLPLDGPLFQFKVQFGKLKECLLRSLQAGLKKASCQVVLSKIQAAQDPG